MPAPHDPRTPTDGPLTDDSEQGQTAAGFRLNTHVDPHDDADWPDGELMFQQAVQPGPAHQPAAEPPTWEPDPPSDLTPLARIGGWVLIGIGILALVSTRELPLPLFLAGLGVALAYVASPARLTREQIVDRWDCLIPGAQDRGDEVLDAVTGHIDRQALPFVEHAERDLAASLFRGGTRTFLVIWHNGNGRLGPYRMHVNVRDYGTNLQTSWFLTYHRSFFERLKPNPLVALNLFDEQDLRAYVTAVHHGFLDAVVDLMLALGQDASKLDRKTNGFLGIS